MNRYTLLFAAVLVIQSAFCVERTVDDALVDVAKELEVKGKPQESAKFIYRALYLNPDNVRAKMEVARIEKNGGRALDVYCSAEEKDRVLLLPKLKEIDNSAWKIAVAYEEYDSDLLRIAKAYPNTITFDTVVSKLKLKHPCSPELMVGKYFATRNGKPSIIDNVEETWDIRADGTWVRVLESTWEGTWKLEGKQLVCTHVRYWDKNQKKWVYEKKYESFELIGGHLHCVACVTDNVPAVFPSTMFTMRRK